MRSKWWAVFLAAWVVPAWAVDAYYERKAEGWFWYEDPPVVEEQVEESAPSPAVAAEEPPDETPAQAPGPRPLSVAWFRQQTEELRDKAIEEPTEENIRAYMYVQRAMFDMAERFAMASQRVVMSDAMLDENTRNPTATFGRYAKADEAKRGKVKVIEDLVASGAGFWYFYRSDCPYCAKQEPLLLRLKAKYGLAILPISIDGGPPQTPDMPQFVVDRGQAEQFGLAATPALAMVRKGEDPVAIGQGLLSLDAIEDRMVEVAYQAGWIDDSQYESTHPTQVMTTEAGSNAEREGLNFDDPVALAEWLRSRIREPQPPAAPVVPPTTKGQEGVTDPMGREEPARPSMILTGSGSGVYPAVN